MRGSGIFIPSPTLRSITAVASEYSAYKRAERMMLSEASSGEALELLRDGLCEIFDPLDLSIGMDDGDDGLCSLKHTSCLILCKVR